MSSIDEIISSQIEQKISIKVTEVLEPLQILKGFEGVEVLTLEEMSTILRKDKEIIRAACHRGEIPHQPIGRDLIFPKRLVIDFLMGVWQKNVKPTIQASTDKRNKKLLAFVS